MDFLTIFGVFFAVAAIVIGQFLEGGHIVTLMNFPALIIVVGGSLGAVMVETPFKIFLQSARILPWIIFPPNTNADEFIMKIVAWGTIARRNGVLSLDSVIDKEHDPFVIRSLNLLIDGGDPKLIRKMLEIEVESRTNIMAEASKVFESMGGYSPTIGIIGAVMGLIHVMNNLSDPQLLGRGIAVAFVATIYGVGFANIIFVPVANKLQRIIMMEERKKRLLIEGIISISNGENPRLIEAKLKGYK